jgi:anaerobic ribonucleoside-triphosphate reductase activating protein
LIKYDGYYVTFQEVPNEISLVFTVTNCIHNCLNCHSPWLKENIGKNLETDFNDILIKYENMITCVCFMGEGNDSYALINLIKDCKYKTALYTGIDELSSWMLNFDYIKIGHYEENLGALDSPTTNQRFFRNVNGELENITDAFIKTKR